MAQTAKSTLSSDLQNAQAVLANPDVWSDVKAVFANCTEHEVHLDTVYEAYGVTTYALPDGSIAVTLPGKDLTPSADGESQPVSLESVTLLRLPDGTELVRHGNRNSRIDLQSHGEALEGYLNARTAFATATGHYLHPFSLSTSATPLDCEQARTISWYNEALPPSELTPPMPWHALVIDSKPLDYFRLEQGITGRAANYMQQLAGQKCPLADVAQPEELQGAISFLTGSYPNYLRLEEIRAICVRNLSEAPAFFLDNGQGRWLQAVALIGPEIQDLHRLDGIPVNAPDTGLVFDDYLYREKVSRHYAPVCEFLGDVCLEQDAPEGAMRAFQAADELLRVPELFHHTTRQRERLDLKITLAQQKLDAKE